MNTVHSRRRYDREFKLEAVRLVTQGGRSIVEVAKDLGIHENLLYNWRRKYLDDTAYAFPGKGHLKPADEEMRRLKRTFGCQRGARHLKKSLGHLLKAPQMKCAFIEEYGSGFRVKKMCRTLSVSRSRYYAWKRRSKGFRQQENERLLEKIREAHKLSRRTYGSPRIAKELKENNIPCGKNRVARLMRIGGIYAKTKRRFRVTTHSNHKLPVAENLLNRRFKTDRPNKVWLSDITYIRTQEGWLYLSAILDLYNRQIIGWSMEDRLTQDLVLQAFQQALGRRKPDPGVVFHSDRGSQYAAQAFRTILDQHQFSQSMSAKGNCYDNAVMESFFHTLKTEVVYFERYRTRAEARQSIFEYIEVFYNRIRRHSSLGYLSPLEFENRMALKAA